MMKITMYSNDATMSPFILLQTETALMYDAVHLFAKAMHEVSNAQQIDTVSLSCNKAKTWSNGESLINYMKMVGNYSVFLLIFLPQMKLSSKLGTTGALKYNECVSFIPQMEIEGLTGTVKFDNNGQRSQFKLDLVELTKDGLQKVDEENT